MQILSMLALSLISSDDPLPSFRINSILEEMPVVGSPFVLKVIVRALVRAESVEAYFHAQDGVEILTGELCWKGNLEMEDSAVLTYTVLVDDTGKYNVWTTVATDGRGFLFNYNNSELSTHFLHESQLRWVQGLKMVLGGWAEGSF